MADAGVGSPPAKSKAKGQSAAAAADASSPAASDIRTGTVNVPGSGTLTVSQDTPGVATMAEENNFNMNMITYGLVHYNLNNRLIKRSSTSTGGAQFAFFHHPHISEFLSNIPTSGCGTFSTSRYSDVVATSIVVISDLDFRFSGIEFLIFNCVVRQHA